MPWECGEQIETAEVKLENSEEKIPTHAAHEWGCYVIDFKVGQSFGEPQPC
jgi:hypothetical protein